MKRCHTDDTGEDWDIVDDDLTDTEADTDDDDIDDDLPAPRHLFIDADHYGPRVRSLFPLYSTASLRLSTCGASTTSTAPQPKSSTPTTPTTQSTEFPAPCAPDSTH